ncbi:MAG: S41 family peptidase [Candidatus Shapirobacteria bacterium]
MKIKYIRNVVLALVVLTLVSLVSFSFGQKSQTVSSGTDDQLNLSMMWKVKDKLSQLYLDKSKMDKTKMEYGAIEGMVAALDDPYTVFLPPSQNKSSNEDLAGQFGGVGISLGYKDKTLAVMSPVPKTPAEKAGIKAGDLILKIVDKEKKVDKDTAGMALEDAVNLIRGKVGTEVTLTLLREGGKATFDVTLKRDNIVVPSVELEFKEQAGKKIAWIKMYKFTDELNKQWPEIISKIKKEGGANYGGIVLDLRNNPGGFLDTSVMIASDFIKEGVVVKQESSDGTIQTYNVDSSRGALLNDKLVVLVNGGSASAAEILSGALKDYNRGKLVGEKTFGKGTVQQPENFSDGSGLHITIAKWLLPNGANIHKVGINPDIEVKPTTDPNSKDDLQLNKAIEVLLQK